eukprot:4733193-Pleurochrysis_carterae.AAC.1
MAYSSLATGTSSISLLVRPARHVPFNKPTYLPALSRYKPTTDPSFESMLDRGVLSPGDGYIIGSAFNTTDLPRTISKLSASTKYRQCTTQILLKLATYLPISLLTRQLPST